MSDELKFIEDPTSFLIDSGLLFEVNRRLFHPLGLALAINKNPKDKEQAEVYLWDCRDDKEGLVFSEETFKDGKDKFSAYLAKEGGSFINGRYEALGYIEQSFPNAYLKDGVTIDYLDPSDEIRQAKIDYKFIKDFVKDHYGLTLTEFMRDYYGTEETYFVYTQAKKANKLIEKEE